MDYELRIDYSDKKPVYATADMDLVTLLAGLAEKQTVVESIGIGNVRLGRVYEGAVALELFSKSSIGKLLEGALSITLFRRDGAPRPSVDKFVLC